MLLSWHWLGEEQSGLSDPQPFVTKTYLPLAHILSPPLCIVKINFDQFTGLVQGTGIVSSGTRVAG